MNNQLNRLSFINHKYKFLVLAYLLTGLWVTFEIYLGISSFFITAYIYSALGFVLYSAGKKLKLPSNILLLIFSALLALFVAEFVLRFIVKYPITYSEQRGNGYSSLYKSTRQDYLDIKLLGGRKDIYTLEFDSGEVRNYNCADYQFPAETCNALGLRGKLPGKTKNLTAFFGDSFTEGVGAPIDSSIPALVGKHITDQDSNTAVLNAGVSGNDIFFDWQMVQKLAPRYHLKELVFIINTTDITDVVVRGGIERFCPNGNLSYNAAPWWEPLYAVSFVFRLAMHNAFKLNYLLLSPEQEASAKVLAVKKITALLNDKIAPWAKGRDILVTVVLIPIERDTQPKNEDYTGLSKGLMNVEGVRFLDCLSLIKAVPNISDLYWPADKHFKPGGYNLISRYIIDNYYRPDSLKEPRSAQY